MPKIIPFNDRMLVKRRPIGDKIGSIILPDETKDRPTDLADVIYISERTFADNEIIKNAEGIITSLTIKALDGDYEAVEALLKLNKFLKLKSIKQDDVIMISKYSGITFHEKGGTEELTIVDEDDIIGLVIDKEVKNG